MFLGYQTDLLILKEKNVGGPKEALANLKGKRYVVASELEDGRRLIVDCAIIWLPSVIISG